MNTAKRGSQIAKSGFKNELDIIDKFNHWETDVDAKAWLRIMGYDINVIKEVKAIKLSKQKSDVRLQVKISPLMTYSTQNIQIKLVSNLNGFNQIDKRWINTYDKIWSFPKQIKRLLKLYTGELPPRNNTQNKKRMFATEFTSSEKKLIIDWLKSNERSIVKTLLKGSGEFAADWILVIQKFSTTRRWALKSMHECINFFSEGAIEITNRGTIKIGRITMQRKGGNAGRKTAQMLQFKINPAKLFEQS